MAVNQPPKGPPPRTPADNGFDWPLDDDAEGLAAFPAEGRPSRDVPPRPAGESEWTSPEPSPAEASPSWRLPEPDPISPASTGAPGDDPDLGEALGAFATDSPSGEIPAEAAREVAPDAVPPAAVVMTGAASATARPAPGLRTSPSTAAVRPGEADARTDARSRFEIAQRARLEQRRTLMRVGAVLLGVAVAGVAGYVAGRRSGEPPPAVSAPKPDASSPATADGKGGAEKSATTPAPHTDAPGSAPSVARSAPPATAVPTVAAPPVSDVNTGSVDITSNPPGLKVMMVGVTRGVTPLTVRGLPPGLHDVQLSRGGRGVIRKVLVSAGKTSKLDVALQE